MKRQKTVSLEDAEIERIQALGRRRGNWSFSDTVRDLVRYALYKAESDKSWSTVVVHEIQQPDMLEETSVRPRSRRRSAG